MVVESIAETSAFVFIRTIALFLNKIAFYIENENICLEIN